MGLAPLTDTAPVIAAILGPTLAFAFATMRVQHRDTLETRELIQDSSRETREHTARQLEAHRKDTAERLEAHRKDTAERLDRLSGELAEHKKSTDKKFDAVINSLGHARERLARIEGHLRIGHPAPAHRDENEPTGSKPA